MKVKKFSKRAFAVLLTVLIVLSAVPLCAGAVEDTSDFKYELHDDGTATITRYRGSASSLVIPSEIDGYKVTGIDFQAFADCKSLTSVTIPDSVTSIGIEAFSGCISLENINVDNNNADYTSENGVLFNKEKTELIGYPAGKPLTGYSIPESVTSIGRYAFSYCTSLTSITIPESVTSIGDYAFAGCTSLISITIPDSVKSIGSSVFDGCTSLASVTIPDSVTSISSYAFYGCTSLTSVTIPSSVTSINNGAFHDCTSLVSVTIPESVTIIYDGAFYGCTSLENVIIPDSVTDIGTGAFGGCTSLSSIIIPDSVTMIGQGAFHDCTSLTSVTISDSVTWIDDGVFWGCTSLASVTIPNSVTSIGWHAFKDCESLTNITIPNSVTFIIESAFDGCTSLTSVTIPNSVTNIGEHAVGYTKDSTKIENFTICGYTGTEAENYAVDNGFTFIALDNESNIHNDSSTGISVTAKVDTDADLTVSEITDEQSISEANLMLAQGESVKNLYDISLTKDGEKIQHEGMAEVKIPCDNENAKVYRVESDNTLTDMNAVYTDGNLVFHTEHFSRYIVASQSEKIFGDINANGKVDVTDVTALQNLLAKSADILKNPEFDLNGDGKVNVVDVTYLQQYLAGSII